MTAVGGTAEDFERYQALVGERLSALRARIERAGGDPAQVTVVAATKTFGLDAVLAALGNGIVAVGENYANEFAHKVADLAAYPGAEQIRWHFLGQIQRNKLKLLAGRVALYESVDRLEEGTAISRRDPGAHVLVEVDTTGDPTRGGVAPERVGSLVAGLAELDLVVDGLMTVAPAGGGEPAASAFRRVATLADELGLPVRSMGMSEDLELAVAAGSNMVRIGRALFGSRP